MSKLKVIVVGCGDRACVYAEEAVFGLECMEVVACVDPDPVRRKYMHDHFGVSEDRCFEKLDDLLKLGKIADAVINGTMDQYHLQTAVPLLEQGYNMLLEKPIVNNAPDLLQIRETALKHGCTLVICHVLRYTPFYKTIKELCLAGEIGKIRHIETSERVTYGHASMAYLRGKWKKRSECGSSLLLAKCCHDTDLLCWFNNDTTPSTVTSYGGRYTYLPENAPEGAGTRCLVDCPEEVRKDCIFDAQKIHIDTCILPWYPWQCTGKNYQDVTLEEKIESLKTYNPHGECVYKTDTDLVDQQTVTVRFANGSTAQHTVMLGVAEGNRYIWIAGSKGEIEGNINANKITVRKFDPSTGLHAEKVIEYEPPKGFHAGGDRGLVRDFCALMQGEKPSVSCTSIDDSIYSHLLVYAADESMEQDRPIQIQQL